MEDGTLTLEQEYAAFLKLRIVRPNLERPYKLPLNTTGCILFMIPPIALCVFVMSLASFRTYGFALVANAIGLLLFEARKKHVKRYNRLSHEEEALS